ncbi:MAG: hypothetical protein ACI88A_002125 [Paraglaciecola sp.]|jgi:hypothetical protein
MSFKVLNSMYIFALVGKRTSANLSTLECMFVVRSSEYLSYMKQLFSENMVEFSLNPESRAKKAK